MENRLVIDGNTVYEIDEECEKQIAEADMRHREKENKESKS